MSRIIAISIPLSVLLILTGCGKKTFAPPPVPLAPSNLRASPTPYAPGAQLYWNDNSDNEDGFYVYRKTTGQYSKIASLDINSISYMDTGLNLDTYYWYKITAYNDGGESDPSNEDSVTTYGY